MVRAPGLAPHYQTVTVTEDGTLDLDLEPATVFTGTVVRSDGRPAAGANVRARVGYAPSQSHAELAVTDQQGQFRLPPLPVGPLEVVVLTEDEVLYQKDIEAQAGTSTHLALRLAPGARIHGRIVDRAGRPVPHIQVLGQARAHPVYYSLETRADERGAFDIGPFLPGKASVSALLANNRTTWAGLPRPEQTNVELTTGEDHRGVQLVVARGNGHLAGRVLTPDGEPLPDARILASPLSPHQPARKQQAGTSGLSVVSDHEGRFVLPDLGNDRYALWAQHPAYADAHLPEAAIGTDDIALAMNPPAAITGTFVTAEGEPVVDYDLIVSRFPAGDAAESQKQAVDRRMNPVRPRLTIRDPRGRFSVDRLVPGLYELALVSPHAGLVGSVPRLDVRAERLPRRMRIVAEPGVTVTGKVVVAGTGQAPERTEVSALSFDGYQRRATNPDGRFRLAGLPLTSHVRIVVRAASEGLATRIVERPVPPSRLIDVGTVVLEPGGPTRCDCK